MNNPLEHFYPTIKKEPGKALWSYTRMNICFKVHPYSRDRYFRDRYRRIMSSQARYFRPLRFRGSIVPATPVIFFWKKDKWKNNFSVFLPLMFIMIKLLLSTFFRGPSKTLLKKKRNFTISAKSSHHFFFNGQKFEPKNKFNILRNESSKDLTSKC